MQNKDQHRHNHHTENAFGDVLRHRRPCPEVVEAFTQMFTDEKTRITPVQAMEMHTANLENTDPDRISMGDGALCPEMSWVYKLYNKIMKSKCGEPFGPEMISSLQKSVEEYNDECKEICAKIGSTEDGKHHFVVVCSPMMKRVLTHHKSSAEIMFIDSSGNMDNCNARIFVILTASVVCGLPEGLIITFSECEQVITSALLWKEIIPSNSFYGRGLQGPKVIISDDCAAERNSLGTAFPAAVLLLCIFHVLQAMWRYIWDSRHRVKFEDKPYIYYLFRQLLYTPNLEDFNCSYEEALADEKLRQYSLVLEHIDGLRKRAHEWALCHRNNLLLRGHNTNNYCEIAMRIIKDCILGRVRAYNTVQLFNILMKGLDNYYKRKLSLVVNNRMRNCRSRLRVKPAKVKCLEVQKLFSSDHLYKVKNLENTEYIVDSELEICSCKVGCCGAPCKHQLAVVKEFKISHRQFLPTTDAAFKMVLYFIMTGKTTAPDGFFNLLKDKADVVVEPIPIEENVESSSQVNDNNEEVVTADTEEVTTDDQSPENVSESLKARIFEVAEDLHQKICASPDYLSEPLEKFLKSYWSISKRKDSDSTFASALATFGKDQLPSAAIGRRRTIHVQLTSQARRSRPVKGRQALQGGRPRESQATSEHDYNKTLQRKRLPAEEPSWACPPKKPQKVPHSVSQCVEANVRLPK